MIFREYSDIVENDILFFFLRRLYIFVLWGLVGMIVVSTFQVSMTKKELKVFSVLLTLCTELVLNFFFFTLKMTFKT